MRYLYVLAGGAAGSLLRYCAGVFIGSRYSGVFPLATFLVNVTGSFLIGVAMSRLTPDSALRFLLVSGFLGGYTTFSALQWETLAAAQSGLTAVACFYMAASAAVGYAACWLGAWVSNSIR